MKIREGRLIREAGSITTPQHSGVGGGVGEEQEREEAADNMEEWWVAVGYVLGLINHFYLCLSCDGSV